ncbi:YdeI/OmpD-associated family protein [Ekhidna sp. To15]|uniref:YdeI/OmpD-associated family protein n=1 Tax=Ekhidna sp. To15 TaxID=3395267 RepID=UPI003F51FC70
MKMANSPHEYFESVPDHLDILKKLQFILLSTELEEKMKWGIPTYCLKNKNVVGIGAFKAYVGIWFFNGVFLQDKADVLINAQEGKTKGLRQWRFESIDDIDDKLVLSYINEAIQNQKDGKELKPEKKPLTIPDVLKEALASDSQLSETFESLSHSCKREYAEYIEEAKRAETKQKRLDKIIPMIMDKVGLNDKYK